MEVAIGRRRTAAGPGIAAGLLVWLAALLAGCVGTVRLVGDYDGVLDQSVMRLQIETSEFFAGIPAEAASVPEAAKRPFLAKATGSVDAMAARAEALEEGLQRTPLSDNLQALREQFEDLRTMDLGPAPVRESARKALHESFRALQVQLVFMKRAGSQRPVSP